MTSIFYQEIMDWNNALSSYSELHKVDPFHADGHYNLGFIHMELQLFDIATNNFSDAIYSNSNYFQAYYSRGICFETLGNIAQAESDYNRAIEINPSNHKAYSNRGITKGIGFNDDEGACEDIKKAASLGSQYRKDWLDTSEGKWCKDM